MYEYYYKLFVVYFTHRLNQQLYPINELYYCPCAHMYDE